MHFKRKHKWPSRCSKEPKRQYWSQRYTADDVADDSSDSTINQCSIKKPASDTNANNAIQNQNRYQKEKVSQKNYM